MYAERVAARYDPPHQQSSVGVITPILQHSQKLASMQNTE